MSSLINSLFANTSGKWLDEGKGIFITGTNKLLICPYDPLRKFGKQFAG